MSEDDRHNRQDAAIAMPPEQADTSCASEETGAAGRRCRDRGGRRRIGLGHRRQVALHAFQIRAQLRRRLAAHVAIFFEGFENRLLEPWRQIGPEAPWAPWAVRRGSRAK
jgi:hypothetical protein